MRPLQGRVLWAIGRTTPPGALRPAGPPAPAMAWTMPSPVVPAFPHYPDPTPEPEPIPPPDPEPLPGPGPDPPPGPGPRPGPQPLPSPGPEPHPQQRNRSSPGAAGHRTRMQPRAV